MAQATMLTALDFPSGLLYARAGLWVRDDGAGAARLGVHLRTLGRTDMVLHVQLPKAGTRVERGEPLGHIDTAFAAIPLTAPVSGTVFLPNPDLRSDADLVRKDGFGQGYLLDLEDVPEADMQALLDAEGAMAAFSEFEAPGAPYSEVLQERDRPWWTTLSYRVGEKALVTGRMLPERASEVFAPDWEHGQRFAIETERDGKKRIFDYEVEGEDRIAGEPVTRVCVTERAQEGVEPSPLRNRVLYFRLRSFTLSAYDEVPRAHPSAFRRCFNARGEGAYLHTALDDALFLDHPWFPAGRLDLTRDLLATDTLPAVIDHYRFRSGGTRCEHELRAEVKNELGRLERLFSQSIWEAGRPFFTEAVRMLSDKVLLRAKLVTAGA